MKYVVDLGGQRVDVALEEGGARVDGDLSPTHLEQVGTTPVHLVRIGEEVHRVVAAPGEGKGRYTLWIEGHRFVVDAVDERTRTIRDLTAASGAAAGPRPLAAPMPGLVVRVHVAVGDLVVVGQPLVSMEAMKMENELRSVSGGQVTAIHAQPGKAVEKGAVLVELG